MLVEVMQMAQGWTTIFDLVLILLEMYQDFCIRSGILAIAEICTDVELMNFSILHNSNICWKFFL